MGIGWIGDPVFSFFGTAGPVVIVVGPGEVTLRDTIRYTESMVDALVNTEVESDG